MVRHTTYHYTQLRSGVEIRNFANNAVLIRGIAMVQWLTNTLLLDGLRLK